MKSGIHLESEIWGDHILNKGRRNKLSGEPRLYTGPDLPFASRSPSVWLSPQPPPVAREVLAVLATVTEIEALATALS